MLNSWLFELLEPQSYRCNNRWLVDSCCDSKGRGGEVTTNPANLGVCSSSRLLHRGKIAQSLGASAHSCAAATSNIGSY
jgi:hypothetical protein